MDKGKRNRRQRKNASVTLVQDLTMANCMLVLDRTDLIAKSRAGKNIGVTFEQLMEESYKDSDTAAITGFQMLRSITGTHIKDYLESIAADFEPLYNFEFDEYYNTPDDDNLFHRFYGWFWEVYWFCLQDIWQLDPEAYNDDVEHNMLWTMILTPELGFDFYYKKFLLDECRLVDA